MTLTLCQEFGDKVAYFAFLIQYSKLIADVFFSSDDSSNFSS
jgi:hypothetical protein